MTSNLPIRELSFLAVGVLAGLFVGYTIRNAEKPSATSSKAPVRGLIDRLHTLHERLDGRLRELEEAMEDLRKQAAQRKGCADKSGALECLARRRNMRKEFVRLQGMCTNLFSNIVKLENKETNDEVAIALGEGEYARLLQLEDIDGDIGEYRALNNLSLEHRPPAGNRTLGRSFSFGNGAPTILRSYSIDNGGLRKSVKTVKTVPSKMFRSNSIEAEI